MKKFEDHIKKVANEIHLSTDERNLMRGRVVEYMRFTPAIGVTRGIRIHTQTVSVRFAAVFAMLALLFTSGVGVSYASNDALPGDALYVVKEMQEGIVAFALITDAQKAQWEVERVHRRLEEAEALAHKGELTEETEVLITMKYAEQADRANVQIDAVEENDPQKAQALRVALTVGIEARAEALAMGVVTDTTTNTKNEEKNEIRARIAQSVLSGLEESANTLALVDTGVGYDGEERIEVLSSIAAREVTTSESANGESAAVDERTDTGSLSADAAVRIETLQVAPVRDESAGVVAELVKVLTKQKQQLKEKRARISDEVRGQEIEDVLEYITKTQKSISVHIQARNYSAAKQEAQEALRAVHKAQAAIEADIDVSKAALPPEREEASDQNDIPIIQLESRVR